MSGMCQKHNMDPTVHRAAQADKPHVSHRATLARRKLVRQERRKPLTPQ